MSEVYREHEVAILSQYFKVMADAKARDWTIDAVREWVNGAFDALGLPIEAGGIEETGSIAPDQWRWFEVEAVTK